MPPEEEKALDAKALGIKFGISEKLVNEKLRRADSPGYKQGGKTSKWLCFPSKFERLLLKDSEKFKG